jgi:hypothetical protein
MYGLKPVPFKLTHCRFFTRLGFPSHSALSFAFGLGDLGGCMDNLRRGP